MPPPPARILHERGPRVGPYHGRSEQGALSLKSMRGGAALYEVGRARYRVDAGRVLVLNHAQPYAVEVGAPVESFCMFFEPGFAAGVLRAARLSPDALLDQPDDAAARVPDLLVRTYGPDVALTRLMHHARRRSAAGGLSGAALDHAALVLLEALLRLSGELRAEVGRLPWARAATREETYRRVLRAREYADAVPEVSGLSALAEVANLSPHHFVRAFRAVLGVTPGAYLRRGRLGRARAQLRAGGCGVLEAAATAGFASPTSFAAAYRRAFGCAPSAETRNIEEASRRDGV